VPSSRAPSVASLSSSSAAIAAAVIQARPLGISSPYCSSPPVHARARKRSAVGRVILREVGALVLVLHDAQPAHEAVIVAFLVLTVLTVSSSSSAELAKRDCVPDVPARADKHGGQVLVRTCFPPAAGAAAGQGQRVDGAVEVHPVEQRAAVHGVAPARVLHDGVAQRGGEEGGVRGGEDGFLEEARDGGARETLCEDGAPPGCISLRLLVLHEQGRELLLLLLFLLRLCPAAAAMRPASARRDAQQEDASKVSRSVRYSASMEETLRTGPFGRAVPGGSASFAAASALREAFLAS